MSKRVLILMLAASSVPAWSGEAPANCADMQDPAQRLACFDRQFPANAKKVPETATPAVAPAVGTAPTPARPRTVDQDVDATIHARIKKLRTVAPTTYAVSLDNGQTWLHENEHLSGYLREGDAVTIGRGAFGSHQLTRDAGEARDWIRVIRSR